MESVKSIMFKKEIRVKQNLTSTNQRSILMDPDWPEKPYIEIAKKHGLTYTVRIPTDGTQQLRRLVRNI